MLEITTPPQSEPLLLEEVKDHLRIDTDAHDTRLAALIQAARKQAERYLGRSIGRQTLALALDYFPDEIGLPRPPVVSVTEIEYTDPEGLQETLDPSLYRQSGARLAPLNHWPRTARFPGVVRVTYEAGVSMTPEPIRQAMLVMIERLFDRHVEQYDDTLARLSDMLLWPYRQVAV
ncbi:head-tail connector protein [Salinisphaera orenii]|uniref:Phage gp6-like head-tail connector protein n=1 Tax=Salinisphaera orenii YIM 95161 TaxID=1051139 RepID=A0A423PMG3_9GAMM|nr:head-tail connector protein [Salinisphaera halophila]ROO26691.1 hypothetical protein SAHL_12255 [Salinisphaera halophila YIM 95161]